MEITHELGRQRLDAVPWRLFVVWLSLVWAWAMPALGAQEERQLMRNRMLEEILETGRETGTELDPAVLDAMGRVPREQFVPASLAEDAYDNRPLPIGLGQTISQPFIVALMTGLLQPKPTDRVLELGTGSGYQAAVLAELVADVFTIEIVEPLGTRAAARLRDLGYSNVQVRIGNGLLGWPEEAPFDGIIVTAAGLSTPPNLVRQLKTGGRLVLPLGGQHEVQFLMVMIKQPDGSLQRRTVLPVRFVPITGSDDGAGP